MAWKVDVEFRASSVDGTGIFARKAISAGTRVWEVDEGMHFCDRKALLALGRQQLRFALHGGYLHKPSDTFLWYQDGMQYMNHALSPQANVGLGMWPALMDDHTIALRDIAPGEELFEDYTFWADGGLEKNHWLNKIYAEFHPDHLAFLNSLEMVPAAA